MRIYNTDGSEAEACGNGMRCVGWVVAQADRPQGAEVRDQGRRARRRAWPASTASPSTWASRGSAGTTSRWPRRSTTRAPSSCRSARSTSRSCTRPRSSTSAIRTPCSGSTTSTAYDLGRIGPLLENHPIFPERANISLAQVTSPTAITLRTWERGAGLTKACGSAACAGRRVRGAQGPDRPPGDGHAARRPARHRMARRRPHLDDGPGRARARGRARRAGDGLSSR